MQKGFSGDPLTKWLSGNDGFRKMQLLESISFTDHVKIWVADKGRIVDGASIPRALWTAVGAPYVGEYRRPSIIHDIACENAKDAADRLSADKMFYRACRVEGLSRVESAILYAGVRFGAWLSHQNLVEDSQGPRHKESASDAYQQRLFEEIVQPVMAAAKLMPEQNAEDEADKLEVAFAASHKSALAKIKLSMPPVPD